MLSRRHNISLRPVEPDDMYLLLEWENDPENRSSGRSAGEFSEEQIRRFVNAPPELKEDLQVRYMICLSGQDVPIGCVDLFAYHPAKRTASIGILIAAPEFRKKGYASEALDILVEHSFGQLNIKKLFCCVLRSNFASIRLFLKSKFRIIRKLSSTQSYTFELVNPS